MRQLCLWVLLGCLGFATPAWAFVEANSASAADLATIRGLGPSTSQRLVQARQNGPFQSWDDLISRISGVGPATAQKLSDGGLRVQGQAFGAGQDSAGSARNTAEAIWRPMVPKPVPPR